MIADNFTHLWRVDLPPDLPIGAHVITVTATDQHSRKINDRILVAVREERPFPYWDNTLWEAN